MRCPVSVSDKEQTSVEGSLQLSSGLFCLLAVLQRVRLAKHTAAMFVPLPDHQDPSQTCIAGCEGFVASSLTAPDSSGTLTKVC